MSFVAITNNIAGTTTHRSLNGKDYLVVPMVMITEGVHNGSQGPLYYPKDELAKFPAVWNTKPIVVYHPERNGVGLSACEPEVLETRSVGMIMNTKFVPARKGNPAKLRAEAWLEVARLEAVDVRVLEALEMDTPVEVSTGLFTENEMTPGEWKGEKYVGISRAYRPDHLAILPDREGACSLKDGAGLLRNQLSYDNVRRAIQNLVNAEFTIPSASPQPMSTWVEDVYDGFFVYTNSDGKLYKRSYTLDENDSVTLGDGPGVVVRRVTEYRTTDGAFVGNAAESDPREGKETADMAKKQFIDALIANAGYEESDRPMLESMSETKLQNLASKVTVPTETAPAAPVANAVPAGGVPIVPQPPLVPSTAPVANAAPVAPVAPQKLTEEEWFAQAPASVQRMVQNVAAREAQDRAGYIATITNNKANALSAEQLNAMDTTVLQSLAQSFAPAPVANSLAGAIPGRMPAFIGNAGSPPPVHNGAPVTGKTVSGLSLPQMDFEKK